MCRGVDNCDVRESLRKISELAFGGGIVFFGEQAEIVSECEQALEQRDRIVAPANQRKAVGEPETAREEDAFARRQSIRPGGAWVAAHKPIMHKLALDRRDRAANAQIVRRQKPELRDEQQRSVELARAVMPDEGAAFVIIALREDLLGDLVAQTLPMSTRSVEPVLFDRFDRTVESYPGHDFGKGEVARLAAYLPDPLV